MRGRLQCSQMAGEPHDVDRRTTRRVGGELADTRPMKMKNQQKCPELQPCHSHTASSAVGKKRTTTDLSSEKNSSKLRCHRNFSRHGSPETSLQQIRNGMQLHAKKDSKCTSTEQNHACARAARGYRIVEAKKIVGARG